VADRALGVNEQLNVHPSSLGRVCFRGEPFSRAAATGGRVA
jgi:hypothetical protein